MARLSDCHTEGNYLKNQKFTQSFHLVAASGAGASWPSLLTISLAAKAVPAQLN
jgi:hypothetical protein